MHMEFVPLWDTVTKDAVGDTYLHAFGWTWNTRVIRRADVGQRVYLMGDGKIMFARDLKRVAKSGKRSKRGRMSARN